MKYAHITQTELKELFKRYIAMDMEDLLRKTGSSRTTILRRLKDIGYLTSYNHNGKYFALPEFLNFDDSGLFEHKGIYFFKKGGLQELIIHQINSSEKGYNAEELSSKIKTRVGNQLRLFTKKGMIVRKKYSDVYIYFSIDEPIQQKQISNRERELKISSTPEDINVSNEKITLAYVESKIEIHFRASDGFCCIRSCVLHVLKTQRTTVFSIRYREFIAVETLLFCPEHKYNGNSIIKYDSHELNQIVPPYLNY